MAVNLSPGVRVEIADRGLATLAVDNEDGTWNVDFDDGTEADIPSTQIAVVDEFPLRELPCGVRIVTEPAVDPKPEGWTRFVCFSDTHGLHNDIPEKHRHPGDVLLHGGDFTNTGEVEQIVSFSRWLEAYPATHKIVIAGNHDMTLDEPYYRRTGAQRFHRTDPYDCELARRSLTGCTYLEDSATEVCGYKIWGSPLQPDFCGWAFQLPRGGQCWKRWQRIPHSVDILMTHGPPHGRGDLCSSGVRAGCQDLRKTIEMKVISINIAGHIHEGYGCQVDDVTGYINASTCTSGYQPSNPPIVFDAPPPTQLREKTAALAWKRDETRNQKYRKVDHIEFEGSNNPV